jgi:hypothetical protein
MRAPEPTTFNRRSGFAQFRSPISTNGAPRYKWWRLIENLFGKLKEFKRTVMRADKTDASFSATVHLAAALITR